MMDKFREQSVRFGTEIYTETIGKVDLTSQPIKLWREGEEDNEEPTDTANSVIIATGASAKRMNLPGEETYWQAGISACAVCDGAVPIFRNKPLAVVGGGDSAAEEAVYLTKYGMYHTLLVMTGCWDEIIISTIFHTLIRLKLPWSQLLHRFSFSLLVIH